MPEIIHVYTDGACSPNPGAGGWAAGLERAGHPVNWLAGGARRTTNNRMEIWAALAGLEAALSLPGVGARQIVIVTDSSYVCDAVIKGWVHGWRRRNYIRRGENGDEVVPNFDLWMRFSALLDRAAVTVRRIRGHAGHPQNTEADRRAVAARAKPNALPPDECW